MNADTLETSCRCDVKQSSGGGQSAKTVQNFSRTCLCPIQCCSSRASELEESMNSSTHHSADGIQQTIRIAHNSKRGDARVHDRKFLRQSKTNDNKENRAAEESFSVRRSWTILKRISKAIRETRIDCPAAPDNQKDHAVTRGRDVSLRQEGGHSPEHHTVALDTTDEPQWQHESHRQQNALLETTCPWSERTSTANPRPRRGTLPSRVLEMPRERPQIREQPQSEEATPED